MAPVWLSPDLPPAEALVLTSESAVLSLKVLAGPLPGVAFCVGERTAAAAREAGLETISASGNGLALARLIAARGVQGPLLWLRGEEAAPGLAETLGAAGIGLAEAVVYRQEPRSLSDAVRAALGAAMPLIVPLFSARSARLFLAEAGAPRAPLHLCAISDAVADVARDYPAASLRVATRPDGDSLLDSIDAARRALLSA